MSNYMSAPAAANGQQLRTRRVLFMAMLVFMVLAMSTSKYKLEDRVQAANDDSVREIETLNGPERTAISIPDVAITKPMTPAVATGHVPSSEDEDRQLREPQGEIHITHFFSTFSVSKTNAAYYEMAIVQESWKRAAIRALQSRGIKVEFIDFTMPGDDGSSPSFSKRVDLTWWLQDVKKGRVPTVGEPFYLAKRMGRGKLMMFTNADIGVMPDFYERAWAWAETDFRKETAQMHAMKETARFTAGCFYQFTVLPPLQPTEHHSLCLEDARIFYLHAGGFEELWQDESVRLQIAMMASKLHRKIKADDVTFKKWNELVSIMAPSHAFKVFSDASEDWKAYVSDFTPQGIDQSQLESIPKPVFAGTVTRIDVDYTVNATTWSGTPTDMYERTLRYLPTKGLKHPGNDCFLFHRDHLPHVIQHMGHPAGVRPFGLWLAVSWFMTEHPYRRITATRKKPWTFHVGVGLWGFDNIPWKERATELPSYTLFLAANFDRLSSGNFRKMLTNAPKPCKDSTLAWRSMRFCGLSSNEFCAGNVRFSCYYYYNANLRDVVWYKETCDAIHERREGRVKRPVCNFCNFLFELSKSKRRFECDEGEMEYCEGLGAGVC